MIVKSELNFNLLCTLQPPDTEGHSIIRSQPSTPFPLETEKRRYRDLYSKVDDLSPFPPPNTELTESENHKPSERCCLQRRKRHATTLLTVSERCRRNIYQKWASRERRRYLEEYNGRVSGQLI